MEKTCSQIKEEAKKKFNRVKGQLNGIEKMINEERDTLDIINQISAVRAALSVVATDLLKSESNECFNAKDEKERLKKFEELVSNFFKVTK